jgi:diguanylate cyclase (GGDEF)-like protein/PAS domain S-box-containing protein
MHRKILIAGAAPALDEFADVLAQAEMACERVADLFEAESHIEGGLQRLLVLHANAMHDESVRMVLRLRKAVSSADLPIIVLVSRGRDDLMAQAISQGADDCIDVPIHAPLAVARVKAILARQVEASDSANQRERFNLVVRGAGDGIWDWRLAENEVYFSPRWRELLGYGPDDRFATMEDWLALIHAEDKDTVMRALRNHLEGITLSFQVECRLRHKSQAYRWFSIRGASLRDSYGHAVRMAGSLTDISERKLTDPMTGLPNRIMLYDRINQAIVRGRRRKNSAFGIILIQIDRYETMREAYGQAFCDSVEKIVSERVSSTLRMTDTLTIMSERTLCILVDVMREDTDLVRVAQRVRFSAEEPVSIGEETVVLTLSIGMAQGEAHHQSADELIKDATAALNRASQQGAGREVVYDPEMQRRARDRLRIETDLHQALHRDELRLYFQPIVEMESSRIAGFEALVRWEHPVRGTIMPLDFIPVAEESGQIVAIGEWVFRQAAKQAVAWRKECATKDLFVSVNVSSRQLEAPNLVEALTKAIEASGVPANCLHIELTESAIMKDISWSQAVLQRLRALGCRIALDDFGTGYSSLSLLQTLPLDSIKIDRSFVVAMANDATGEAMMRALLQIADVLHLDVVAEGIESEVDELQLRKLGTQFGQGWRYGRPMPADAWAEILRVPAAGAAE